MKNYLFLFFVLNIYTAFISVSFCQEIIFEISGRNSKEDSIIRATETPSNYKDSQSLHKNLNNLRENLISQGYLDYKQDSIKKIATNKFKINASLGKLYKELHINHSSPFINKYLKSLQVDHTSDSFKIELSKVEYILNKFTTLEAENGYPFTSFNLENIYKQNGQLNAYLNIANRNKRKLDSIAVKGYTQFPRSFLKYSGGIHTKNVFNQKNIEKQTETLDALPFVTSKRTPEILFQKEKTILFYYLEKNPSNRFDGFIGFGTNEDTNKLRIDGFLDLFLLNNLNYGESLKLNYKSDGNDQQSLKASLNLPYLLSSPVGLGFEFNLFRQDSTFSTTSQEININYQINSKSSLKTLVHFEKSNQIDDNQVDISNFSDFSKNLYGLGISYTPTVMSSLFSSQKVSASVFYGNRNVNNQNTNQIIALLNSNYTFKINPKNNFYIANTSSAIFSKDYYTNELYRFGGLSTIRGFRENSITANLFTVFNTEYRYIPVKNFSIHSIFDVAYFENDIQNNQEFIYSVGIGSAILTKSGILRINLANGIQNNSNFTLSNTILHLRFIAYF